MDRAAAHTRTTTLAGVTLALAALGLVIHALWLAGVGAGVADDFINNGVYNAVLVLAALTCLLRAVGPSPERGAWLAFGLGLGAWAAADIYWTAALADVRQPPYPSLADALYLLAYPCMYVGVLLLIRQRVRFSVGSWLDGAIGGLAAAALATAALAPALVGLTKGDPAVVATNLAYPLGDVLLLSFLIAGFAVAGVRVGRSWLLVGIGLAAWGVADPIYLYQEATGSYAGGYLDSLWLVGGLAIAAAALTDTQPGDRCESHSVLFPAVFGSIAVGVLAWDHYERIGEVSVWLAVATLAAVVVRLLISFRENRVLLAAVRRDAVTDALTGLGNRRALTARLRSTTDSGDRDVFAIFDLDGFKAYNDSFGHPAGDILLRRLGRDLERAVAPEGHAYRLGGDEFCVLMPGGPEDIDDVLRRAGKALSERGEGFEITASSGAVALPDEAADPTDALRTADSRMYAAKGQRASSAGRQARDVLLRLLREREPGLGDHLRGVARLAAEIGRAAGMDAEDLDSLVRAAELHDIGKIAIPDRVLHKPGPLDDEEWALMRTHTTIGERILAVAPAMAPVATLVRSSHERWDGAGYPDGLAADEIPFGARVIFVCDAFEAMIEERAYRESLEPAEALAELERCAGSQFDPEIVALFATRVFPGLAVLDFATPAR